MLGIVSCVLSYFHCYLLGKSPLHMRLQKCLIMRTLMDASESSCRDSSDALRSNGGSKPQPLHLKPLLTPNSGFMILFVILNTKNKMFTFY